MSVRILEIGHLPWVKLALPEQTEHVDTNFALLADREMLGKLRTAIRQVWRLFLLAFQPPREVVFCRCLGRFIYRIDMPLPVNLLRWVTACLIRFCVWMQVRRGARLAVVDHLDESTLSERDLPLLRLATRYFKRELPQNVWNVFLRVQPPHGEFYFLTQHPVYRPQVDKFLPISLGITAEKVRLIEETVAVMSDDEKTLDVFYAGPIDHSTVRADGWRCLEELRRRGLRVEMHKGGLPFEEFVRQMRRAWLVWSPEGQGWDCYRHYEICVAGAVPLLNYPTLRRYRPLLSGVHAVYYAVEGEDLCRRVEQALTDLPSLRRMAAAARKHVLDFHTEAKQGRYMAEQMLRGDELAPVAVSS